MTVMTEIHVYVFSKLIFYELLLRLFDFVFLAPKLPNLSVRNMRRKNDAHFLNQNFIFYFIYKNYISINFPCKINIQIFLTQLGCQFFYIIKKKENPRNITIQYYSPLHDNKYYKID